VLIFAADIHLRPDRADEAERFVSWLSQAKAWAESVYILGDLFDYWYTGIEPRFEAVLAALSSPRVRLLPGNRDFLLRNAELPGISVIRNEETVIAIGGQKVMLAHGHTLMEADRGFRLLHRYGWPVLELLDRALSPALKEGCARWLVRSSAAIRPSSGRIRKDIEREKGVDMVICGHLHRFLSQQGLIVLPAFAEKGGWLAWDDAGPRLCP
jgi:UDP-2,3-diacylglucosamine hydrolase